MLWLVNSLHQLILLSQKIKATNEHTSYDNTQNCDNFLSSIPPDNDNYIQSVLVMVSPIDKETQKQFDSLYTKKIVMKSEVRLTNKNGDWSCIKELEEILDHFNDLITKEKEIVDKCELKLTAWEKHQQKKRENLLLELWNSARGDARVAEVRAIVAARNYYNEPAVTNNTNNKYIQVFVSPRINEEFQEQKNKITMKMQDISSMFHIMAGSSITEQQTLGEIDNLYSIKRAELERYNKQRVDYLKYNNIDVRKNFYEYNEQEFYQYIKFFIQIIYYTLILVYLFFVDDFMTNTRYKDWRFYLVLAVYILFPLAIKYLVGFGGELYDSVSEYFGWKEAIYSYEDLVKSERQPR